MHRKTEPERMVYIFSDKAEMRFIPKFDCQSQQQSQKQTSSLSSKISKFFFAPSKERIAQKNQNKSSVEFGQKNSQNKIKQQNSSITKNVTSMFSNFLSSPSKQKIIKKDQNVSSIEFGKVDQNQNVNEIDISIKEGNKSEILGVDSKKQEKINEEKKVQKLPLRFLEKLNSDTILIGNQNQIDSLSLANYENQIQTDYNWSLNILPKIENIAVDVKKNYIALQSEKELIVYHYENKFIKNQPSIVGKITVDAKILCLHFLKDGMFASFMEEQICVYQIGDSGIRPTFKKKYPIPDQLKLKFKKAAKPIESSLNVFFEAEVDDKQMIVLYRCELSFKMKMDFKIFQRIYEVPEKKINICNLDCYNKDTFLLNFNYEITLAKQGFIMDSMCINKDTEQNNLVIINDKVLHITPLKCQIYNFKIDLSVKPNKIMLQTSDSLFINSQEYIDYRYFGCLEMLNNNYAIFYEKIPSKNKRTKGEIQYVILCTKKISKKQKIKEIFNFKDADELRQQAENNIEKMQQRCDTAAKIGLSRREIYLELWNRSNKNNLEDFRLLLDTMDYDIIKIEIEKKLKKSSMVFREVYKIEQGCFGMLKEDLFSPYNCTEKVAKNYLVSHFLLRKLDFFKDISVLHKDEVKDQSQTRFMINIQNYTKYSKMDLKMHLLEYFQKLVFEEKPVEKEIRLFIKHFKFQLSIFYFEFLGMLIKQSKNKIIDILQIIPQLLPFEHEQLDDNPERDLFKGIWGQITETSFLKNLHLQEVTSIYNRYILQDLTKTIWFKRNYFSTHDLIPYKKEKILKLHQYNNSEFIFYYFIEQLFVVGMNESSIRDTIWQLEENYQKMPKHLIGKVFLYRKLFQYFKNIKEGGLQFDKFLRLKDYQLFRLIFDHQKIHKGCLLKDTKNIYESLQFGSHLYNEGLLAYFASDCSEVSDLKYMLNRLNNQKRQFHAKNEGIYEVLVKGMQMKLKIGSESDIPLSEVMIYIQNIPLSKDNTIIDQLKMVNRVNEEATRFIKMKLNMSILDIVENCQKVMTAIIEYEIKDKRVLEIQDENEVKNITYNILAEVQTVKQKIYGTQYSDLSFFLYLSKIMENISFIEFAKVLLEDKYLLDFFSVDNRIIENLILYMYKWKFNHEKSYLKNQQYISKILNLLPLESECRQFIESQIKFAVLLSSDNFEVNYPLTYESIISITEITEIINNLDGNFIISLNLQDVHKEVQSMQQLCEEMATTSLAEIYEIAIKRLIDLCDLKNVLPLMRRYVEHLKAVNQESFYGVFVYLILEFIMAELHQGLKKIMSRITFYSFNEPLILIDIIERMLHKKFSNSEQEQFLEEELAKVKEIGYKCYNPKNTLIEPFFINSITKNGQLQQKFTDLLFLTMQHLANNRDEFTKPEYMFIFLMLVQNPYMLAKYIHVKKEDLNIRILRSYISYVFREDIFYGNNVLLFGKRMFLILIESSKTLLPIELVTSQYDLVRFEQDEQFAILQDLEVDNGYELKLKKSVEAFTKKILSIQKNNEMNKEYIQIKKNKKQKRVEALLYSKAAIDKRQVSEYPFKDSDDNYAGSKSQQGVIFESKKKPERQFDASKQRKLLESRSGRNFNLYLSNALEQVQTKSHKKSDTPKNKLRKGLSMTTLGMKKNRKRSADITKNNEKQADLLADVDLAESNLHWSGGNFMENKSALVMKSQAIGQPQSPIKSKSSMGQMDQTNQKNFLSKMPVLNQQLLQIQHETSQKAISSVQSLNPVTTQQVRVEITEIDEDAYMDVDVLVKKMYDDVEDDQECPIFNISHLIFQEDKKQEPQEFYEFVRKILQAVDLFPRPKRLSQILKRQILKYYPQIIQQGLSTPIKQEEAINPQILEIRDQIIQQTFSLNLSPKKQSSLHIKTNLSFACLVGKSKEEDFPQLLQKVISALYNYKQQPISSILEVIKQLHMKFPDQSPTSKELIELYVRLESYHTKYNEEIDMQSMFPISGLFIPLKEPKELFKYLKPFIIPFINEANMGKIPKVIHLAFKSSAFEEELYTSYLCIAFIRYDQMEQNLQENSRELEKISGLISMLKLGIFMEKGVDMIKGMKNLARRDEVLEVIRDHFRKKESQNLLSLFEKKLAKI